LGGFVAGSREIHPGDPKKGVAMRPAITHEFETGNSLSHLAASGKLRVAIDLFPRTQPCLHELNQAACTVQLTHKPDLNDLASRPGIPWGELEMGAALTRLTNKAREEFKREAARRRVPPEIAEEAARHVKIQPLET
jgi:hypothetical protein